MDTTTAFMTGELNRGKIERVFDWDKALKILSEKNIRNAVAALEAITRKQGERYFDYIERVKKNEIARKVKLADLTHNIRRCAYDLPNRWGLIRRYAKAYGILTGEWKEKEARGEK